MPEILDPKEIRSGTWGSFWVNGEQVAEVYKCKVEVNKKKTDVDRCRTVFIGKKMTGAEVVGTVGIYNATSRLIQLEADALAKGIDLRHNFISNLDDPDNPNNQRIAVFGASFDKLTLADWEAAQLGKIEVPFTAESYKVLDS